MSFAQRCFFVREVCFFFLYIFANALLALTLSLQVWLAFVSCIVGWYSLVVLEGTVFPVAQALGSPGAYGITCALESPTPVIATALTVLISLTPMLIITAVQTTYFPTVEQRLLSMQRACVTPVRDKPPV